MSGSPERGGRGARPTWLEWLYLVVGLFLVERYFFFYDDAFVYFRYADNLLFLDAGLVYNHGEFVEGFSSPLWMLLATALRATELSWVVLVKGVSFVAFAAFWWLAVRLDRRLAPAGSRGNFALAYLGATYAVACFFSSGMETVLVQLAAVVFALFCAQPRRRCWQLALALLPLVRPELAAPWLLGLAFAWRSQRKLPVAMLASAVLVNGAWLAFRIGYYADLLPNTYYVKAATSPSDGLAYLHDTLGAYSFYGWAAAAALGAILARRRGEELQLAARGVMGLAAIVVAAYVVKIGGAPIHYRYLAFPFCLAVFATGGWVESLAASLAALAGDRARWVPAAAGLVVLGWMGANYPDQLESHPLTGGEQKAEGVDLIYEAAYHRRRIGTDGAKWSQATPAAMRAWRAARPEFRYDAVEIDGWCQRAYRKFDVRIVHMFGLTDGLLARVRMDAYRPGHKMLAPLADQLAALVRASESPAAVVTRAIEAGRAPAWLANAAGSVELLERKIYNDHSFFTNLGLALKFPAPIEPPEMRRAPATDH